MRTESPQSLAITRRAEVLREETGMSWHAACRQAEREAQGPQHGPWSHPHTERAFDLLTDPYANDHAQRFAAQNMPWFGKGPRPADPTIADLWAT